MLALREGDRISNYLLEARVGAGSFGEVWRARHHVFGDVVAIKIPTDPQYVRNLQREGVTIHGLRHPNIVGAVDLDPHADPPYLIMDYVDGPSLREVIDKQQNKFPIEAAASILRGILLALAAAHDRSIIHRDLKPANILLHRPPDDLATITDRSVRVTDFGLGRVYGVTAQSIMQSGSLVTDEGRNVVGTLAYMSPEQKAGDELDARSDLYACGIILFEMLTGEHPQGSELPSTVRSDIPARFDRLFERCYARLERRFSSAGEMLAALSMDADQQAPAGPPPLPTGMVCPQCRRPIHRDDQFCIHCGVQVAESVPQCAACQAFIHSSDRFCIFCGNDLRVLA
ncbi:MAG: serine/threonine-protein kinase [Gammaproteobacteria bacterium]|nr:serine/threonine-protein kinase [Gammaproteobacteria bacterium]